MSDEPIDQALPRGPHDLTRDQVEASQRRRLIAAMTSAVSQMGYVKTSVAEVVQRAGVSRATFYVLFRDKEDCFIQAFDAATEEIGAAMMLGLMESDIDEASMDVVERVEALLEVYLHVLVTYPEVARTFLIEVFAAGPRAIARRRESLNGFMSLVKETVFSEFEVTPQRTFMVKTVVHAMSSMVTLAVGTNSHEELLQLKEPLTQLIRDMYQTELFQGPSAS